MPELRFDNRVAVITGAGRGMGRAYAMLLASRGAKVIVNDVGASLKGSGGDAGPAEEVVQEINAAGGRAFANTDSVSTPAGGRAIVHAAMEHFGRIDIAIHNAGIVRRAPFKEMTVEDFDAVMDVHLRGSFYLARAAFPLMCKAGYGRIVFTGSDVGLYGHHNVANYSTAKAGTIGLSNVIALEGAAEGVKCNVIIPAAVTRMAEGLDMSAYPPMPPELVAPAVAWLAHESCSISGQMLLSVAGRVAKAYMTETRGVYRRDWTIEQIGEHMDAIQQDATEVRFNVVPSGHLDHLKYSFDMARAAK